MKPQKPEFDSSIDPVHPDYLIRIIQLAKKNAGAKGEEEVEIDTSSYDEGTVLKEKGRRLIDIYTPSAPLCALVRPNGYPEGGDPTFTPVHLISVYEVEYATLGFVRECRAFIMEGGHRQLVEIPGFFLFGCDNCPKTRCFRKDYTPGGGALESVGRKWDRKGALSAK